MTRSRNIVLWLLMTLLTAAGADLHAQTCVQVRIRIAQELTFERVAFDAELNLENVLADRALTNVLADINIMDANGDPADDLFFVQDAVLTNVSAIDGTGRIEAAQNATVHWLIVPTVGAGGVDEEGTEYYVGLTLNLGPEGSPAIPIDVVPDSITVYPQPLLQLQYFMPRTVVGDNPLTLNVVEPSEPYTLGLRVRNVGAGSAGNMKIQSGQPEIIENEKGLLISFKILGTQVNGNAVAPSLLAPIGDMPPASTAMVRWTMLTSLLGRFVDFSATYEHADEFGGEKTSLIDSISTYTLIHNVRVHDPADDGILDFLADADGDENFYPDFIFGSTGADYPVTTVGSAASGAVNQANPSTTLNLDTTPAGWLYTRIPDPSDGALALTRVVRSDGVTLPQENAWVGIIVSEEGGLNPEQKFQMVDTDSTGVYTLYYRIRTVLDDPGFKAVNAGETLAFALTSTVAAGLTPTYAMSFTGDIPSGPAPTLDPATGAFEWSPVTDQIGSYEVTFTVTDDGDPVFSDSKTITINVDNPNLIVDAGADRVAVPGQRVTLDATGTQGPSVLAYSWNQVSGPFVVLRDPLGPTPYFTAPDVTENTVMDWTLEVTDGLAREGSDTVRVIIALNPPTAQAGSDQTVDAEANVVLNGSGSTGDAITYLWEQVSNDPVVLTGADTVSPSFTGPARTTAQTYTFRLSVTDELGLTATDLVNITVRPVPQPTATPPPPFEGWFVK